MELDLYSNVTTFLSRLDLFWVFLALALIMVIFTVIETVLTRRKGNINKRVLHFSVSLGLVSIQTALSLVGLVTEIKIDRFYLPLVLLGLSFILYAPVLLLTEKRPVVKDEQIDFAKFLDSTLRAPVCRASLDKDLDDKPERLKPRVEPQSERAKDIDFTHVKNVAERLNYYNLSPTDKRTVTELLNSVAQAENGEFTQELRSKINDYLGMLLKLMSKYNV